MSLLLFLLLLLLLLQPTNVRREVAQLLQLTPLQASSMKIKETSGCNFYRLLVLRPHAITHPTAKVAMTAQTAILAAPGLHRILAGWSTAFWMAR